MINANAVVDGVLTDLVQLDGQVAAVDLVPGEQLLLSRLIDASSYANGRTRLTSVPQGLQEVTISVLPERLVGGQVVPGDTVGVIASFGEAKIGGIAADEIDTREEFVEAVEFVGSLPDTITQVETTHFLLHQVLVTRVQLEELPREELDAEGNPVDAGSISPTGNLLVTLALETKDVERLVFAAEFGMIWMSYEPADAAGHEDVTGTHRGNVFGHPHEEEPAADELVATSTPAAADAEAAS